MTMETWGRAQTYLLSFRVKQAQQLLELNQDVERMAALMQQDLGQRSKLEGSLKASIPCAC